VKYLADECCDASVVRGLAFDDHDLVWVAETSPGADDETVLRYAFEQDRILLTEDKDFGELVVRLGLDAHGILLVLMDSSNGAKKLARIREVLKIRGSAMGIIGCSRRG
jgi:predicted nuclease of predicted toxin-antitoxin system